MLSSTRERRPNAGAKMATLLNKEDCDDFYKSTYGGFFDEDNDQAFESPVESDSDVVDSDFDIDENDEPISEIDDDDESKPKRQRLVVTKAYKEPNYAKTKDSSVEPSTSEKLSRKRIGRPPQRPRYPSDEELLSALASPSSRSEKKLRHSTLIKSKATVQRQAEYSYEKEHRSKHYRSVDNFARLTQEELLEEAKQTEEENLKSLERFQLIELEKKKRSRLAKQRFIAGPIIRYFSTTVPVVEDADDDNIDERKEDDEVLGDKRERTFISFSDPSTFTAAFPQRRQQAAQCKPAVCVVTGLPAKYTDPVTKLPYASLDAFREIRAAYYKFVEENGDRQDPSVAAWLDYRTNQLKS